jgi:hypothetical protein
MKAIVAGLALLVAAVPAQAQTADARWEPWLGCWELTTDNTREGVPAAGQLAGSSGNIQRRSDAAPRVCVTRTPGGVRVDTTVRGQAAVEQTIIADATERPLTEQDCRGTQRAEWSSDGLRFFSHAEVACKDDPAPRRVSGLSMLATNGTWLDVQAITVGSRETVRVRRYYRAAGEPSVPRATIAASSLSLDDVKESSRKVAPRALEAALVETNTGFDLNGRSVVDLDDAGVPDSVIDLLVALSYPERFIVERSSSRGGGGGTTFINDPFLVGWAFGYPAYYDDYFYSPYYYTPFGYSRGSLRGLGLDGGGGIAVVPVPSEPQPSGAGRVVDGQGYTRVRPRETASTDNGASTVTRTSSTTSASAPASSGSSSGSGSTASSGGGYSSGGSSGGSSGDTGRTAQPR